MNHRKQLAAPWQTVGNSTGRQFWRSLEELSDSPEFQKLIEREFPNQASFWPDSLSRRNFLTLMGASLALGGISGCSVKPAPSTEIVPCVRPPEEVVPGTPLFYATAMTLDGGAVGVLVETHLGRPIKIEGNPDHPASQGATSVFHQASILSLYDPDRSQTVRHLGQPRTWDDATSEIQALIGRQRTRQGQGLRILSERIVSPTLQGQIDLLVEQFPRATWHCYEPLHPDSAYEGSRLAFGEIVACKYDFTQADVVVSLDDDFLLSGPGHLRYAADFMNRRRVRTGRDDARGAHMNRLYVVETGVSCTGAKADHRLAVKGAEVEVLARAIAAALGMEKVASAPTDRYAKWAAMAADDLKKNAGHSLVLTGARQPEQVHLLAHAINQQLGNVGQTVQYIAPPEARPSAHLDSLKDLTAALEHGGVETLLILGGNPSYNAPIDVPFVAALKRAGTSIRLGLYENETSRHCHWHLPESHYLEAWSDARAYDGTVSIVQPVIEPLTPARSVHELLAILTGVPQPLGRELVRAHWKRQWQESDTSDFDTRWQTALHDGVVADTAAAARNVSLDDHWQRSLEESVPAPRPATGGGGRLELDILADPSIHDGRFANNGWLQELPKPLTKLTWGNAAIVSPATAARLGLSMGSYAHGGEHGGYHMPLVELTIHEASVQAPLWIMPGHADDTVTLHLGFGRAAAGRVGGTAEESVGTNAYRLRTSRQPWFAADLKLTQLQGTELVACTQAHHQMATRSPVETEALSHYHEQPDFASNKQRKEDSDRSRRAEPPLDLYDKYDYDAPKHKWGMVIDLTTCIGCNACVVACQAENNIPVVGKEQVSRGREMHWIRVDRYVTGPADDPTSFHFQPLPCMHCEDAPCEYVCPVEATVHSAEGLNDMIYNRCVGTRFCSNNCPYKVRRFNFLAFADFKSDALRMQYNPDVTVRSRGVMEKCTYCIQRIRHAEIGEQTAQTPLVDGDVLTACQAACPTRAIVFGDMNDQKSVVKQWKDSPLHYALLEDLNTVPRTTYLAELQNPSSESKGT